VSLFQFHKLYKLYFQCTLGTKLSFSFFFKSLTAMYVIIKMLIVRLYILNSN